MVFPYQKWFQDQIDELLNADLTQRAQRAQGRLAVFAAATGRHRRCCFAVRLRHH